VRRLSAGSAIAQAVLGLAAARAAAFLGDGDSEPVAEGALPYAEVNGLMNLP
jgi:hypothetical protein